MSQDEQGKVHGTSRQEEEAFLEQTLAVIHNNLEVYGQRVRCMRKEIDDMLDHFHDDNPELINLLENSMTLYEQMKRALERNEKAQAKPYFGRIDFYDEALEQEESIYIGKGGISIDTTHQAVVDWRAPVANAYYENGLGKCSYTAPGDRQIPIDLKLKRTYEIEKGKLLDYFDSEVVANDELLTKYLAKNKQAVLGEIVATIQKEQNDIIRKSPYHNIIVQGVAGSGKTTVAMHRISFILYNYQERFRPDDFYIVGSNRILLNYITGVLPDLDVYGVRQMTMEQLFVRLLYEDWDEKKYVIRKSQNSSRGGIKGSLGWFEDLKAYCDELEWNSILRESVYLNPRQFVEGLQDGRNGVYDKTIGETVNPAHLVLLMEDKAVERYIIQNPRVSMQNKINMLNERLTGKIKEEFLGKGVKYTEAERKAILKAYRGRYGGKEWNGSIYRVYREFLEKQISRGKEADLVGNEFDVYDLAALAYIYKRIKETEVISEAHHIVIDEAQDFGMMAYSCLHFCIKDCTYTVMGDVSQNIHFGFGLNDWEELRKLLLPDPMDNFGILKKSYRNTVEISDFATNILHHGRFSSYPVEPIIRHGEQVDVRQCGETDIFREAANVCRQWKEKGFDTIAVVCRNRQGAERAAENMSRYIEIMETDLEKAEFGAGIMVLPVEYTKGLEFDTVLILNPEREEYPVDDGHAKLLYVAATRALHELCVLHTGNLTGLIADPIPPREERKQRETLSKTCHVHPGSGNPASQSRGGGERKDRAGQPGKTENDQNSQDRRPVIRPKVSQAPSAPSPLTSLYSAGKPSGAKGAAFPGAGHAGTAEHTGRTLSAESAGPAGRQGNTGAGPVPGKPARPERFGPNGAGTSHAPVFQGKTPLPAFGDIPPTEKLRPPGHARIDLSIRWVSKEADGLYLQSRYGTLRISPVGSAIMRISFARNGKPDHSVHPGIAIDRTERFWMYKDNGRMVEITTDELALQVDKTTGAIRYLAMEDGNSRGKKLLLAERGRDCRQLEPGAGGRMRVWQFLEPTKEEHFYGISPRTRDVIPLRGAARYLSDGSGELPFLLSDKGYGILMAAVSPVICCDIPAYGSYLYAEAEKQLDFYLIAGKKRDTILNACAYLCGTL